MWLCVLLRSQQHALCRTAISDIAHMYNCQLTKVTQAGAGCAHHAAALGRLVIATLPTAGTSGGFHALLLACCMLCVACGRPAGNTAVASAAAALPGDTDLPAAAALACPAEPNPAGNPSALLRRCCCCCCCSRKGTGPDVPVARPANAGDPAFRRCRSGVVSVTRTFWLGCNNNSQGAGLRMLM